VAEAATQLMVQNVNSTSVTLSWEDSSYCSSNRTYIVVWDSDMHNDRTNNTEPSTATITNLRPNTNYTFRVITTILEGTVTNEGSQPIPVITGMFF